MTGAIRIERYDPGGASARVLASLEREAAHLTRRDGRRRTIVAWAGAPPSIEEVDYDDLTGPRILAAIDLV